MIAALFVQRGGVYWNLPGVDPWDEARDARLYAGPHPVVAHPPCERWGRYWSGGPSAKVRRELGDDEGCFRSALAHVFLYGGVLEHPEASHAWDHFGLRRPPKTGGWVRNPFSVLGVDRACWTCCVEQGHYGHRARKATWLFANVPSPPELIWGPSRGERLDEGFHSKVERDRARAAGVVPRKRLSTAENITTPVAFRDLLLSIARPPTSKPNILFPVSKPSVLRGTTTNGEVSKS
jgi:hypothetical protein